MKVAREMPDDCECELEVMTIGEPNKNKNIYPEVSLFGSSSPSIMDIPEPGVIRIDTNDWTDQEKRVLETLLAVVADRRDNQ